MTMVVVTHEMGFAREVATGSSSWTRAVIVEEGPPAEVFDDAQAARGRKEFVDKIIHH